MTCNIGSLAKNAPATINISLTSPNTGKITTSLSVTSPAGVDLFPLNNHGKIITQIGIPDITPPVITLTGANSLTVTQSVPFTDPGSVVTDNVDTGLVAIVTGAVNTAIVGTYVLTYNASDAAGNVATAVIRTVNVVAPAPVSAPVSAPVPAPAPSGGGGGGCVISTQSGFDPVLPLLALIAGAWLMVRRRKMNY